MQALAQHSFNIIFGIEPVEVLDGLTTAMYVESNCKRLTRILQDVRL